MVLLRNTNDEQECIECKYLVGLGMSFSICLSADLLTQKQIKALKDAFFSHTLTVREIMDFLLENASNSGVKPDLVELSELMGLEQIGHKSHRKNILKLLDQGFSLTRMDNNQVEVD